MNIYRHIPRISVWLIAGLSTSIHAMNTEDLKDSSQQAASLTQGMSGLAPHSANPILPGYYADPSVVEYEGSYYIYVTLDPWGGDTLGCWESDDFKNWTYRELNWPTKAACTSPTSRPNKVWAPSVVEAPNGRFYMYVSVGSEVWVGVADHPTGPWKNALGDKPLIHGEFFPKYHMIDAEAFIDEDGSAYLYWGSGWNWVNGRCFAVKLAPDMKSFAGEIRDVTPANYFEAPLMLKHAGRYHLMYSSGKTTEDSYQVHYATGDNPFGPFTEADNSPILVTDYAKNVRAPGHHTVFTQNGQSYILYHRHNIPHEGMHRQTCVDELNFTADGRIETVVPTHEGPALVQNRLADHTPRSAHVTASSYRDESFSPNLVSDDNYATRWAAAPDANGAWLQLDLGEAKSITRQLIRPEYAWKSYRFTIEASVDGQDWQTMEDFTKQPATGSPILSDKPITARYLRLVFPDSVKGADISLFEWNVF